MDIERLATTALIDRISFCEGLTPFINDGEKEPSWDGHIYIYPVSSNKKTELVGRVPVQVKGKVKNVSKNTLSLSFSADISDLRNYSIEGGVIYFVVAIGDDRGRIIFYKSLLPFDLQRILGNSANKKTKTINLNKLPDEDKAIRQIFLSFIADKKRQASQIVWSEEQVIAAVRDGATLKFHIQPKNVVRNHNDVMREVTTQSFYLYVKTKDGIEFPFAKVEDGYVKKTRQVIDMPVFVNNVKYYDQLIYGFENGRPYIYIGEILRIPFAQEGEVHKEHSFEFTLNGILSKRIADSDFLLALFQYNQIRIGDDIVFDGCFNKINEIEGLREFNTYLRKVKSALEYFGVREDMDIDRLTDIDYRHLNALIQAFDGKEVHFNEKDLPHMFYCNKRIGNILVRILAKIEDNSDGYKLFNAFMDEAHVMLEFEDRYGKRQQVVPWSLFLHMKAEDFLCSNIDYDIILRSIKAMKSEDMRISITIEYDKDIGAINMFLEILKAYDFQLKKDKWLLQFAIDLSDILPNIGPESIINRLQAIKRQRPLTNDEIASLVALRNKYKKKNIVLCAIAILLEETRNATMILAELSEDERSQIMRYPIYNLFPAS